MKKNNLLYVTLMLVLSVMGATSCKKPVHSNAPTPNNVRMLSYNKITKYEMSVPVSAPTALVTESFRFYYDDLNRVSQIVYTGNDTFAIQKRIDFVYNNDTVIKTTRNILGNYVTEIDTFIKNGDGMIVTAYSPYGKYGVKNSFQYYGKLLARNTKSVTNWDRITASSEITYTSVNGDFLRQYPVGKLDVEFNNLTQGLDIDWWQGFYGKTSKDDAKTDSSHIEDVNSNNYTFTKYSYAKDMTIYVDDTMQVKDTLVYPAWDWYDASYHFYTENANRIGDWMQIESFTKYGQNIYLNNHLIESISAKRKNAYITYKYDAFSKITQTSAIVTDSIMNKVTYTYDIQYEEF